MKHPVDVHVGARLRHRRWLIGMTQQQLAGSVGIKFQQIQKYESGANRISASRLWDIAKALEVPISFFFDGLDDPQVLKTAVPKADAAKDQSLDPKLLSDRETVDLVKTYYNLSGDQRRKFLDLCKTLAA